MSKIDFYRAELQAAADWIPYLADHSNLPGPRGNLELAEAAAQQGTREHFTRLLAVDSDQVAENTPQVFVVFCGLVGLGKLLAFGESAWLITLRRYASDSRWRLREAVAIALQKYGAHDIHALLTQMQIWASGSRLEQRAVVAGLSEPALLHDPAVTRTVLTILDTITNSLVSASDRKTEPFRILRQALAYGWSVAAVTDLESGKKYLERWFASPDPDIRWIMRENLKKNRLLRTDPEWVEFWRSRL